MNRKAGIFIFVGIVGLAVLGLYLSQGIAAGQHPLRESQTSSSQEKAKTVPTRLGMPQAYLTSMGSQINIPACAFVPLASGYKYEMNAMGIALMSGGTAEFMVAPVIFPKGAKNILHVDYWALNSSKTGHSMELKMFSCVPEPTGPVSSTLFDSFSSYDNFAITHYTLSPPQGTVWNISPNSFYDLQLTGGWLYGVIVYYQ